MGLLVSHAAESEIREIATFIAHLNARPEHYIGYADTEPDAVLANLKEFHIPPHESFVVARRNGAMVGAFGFDADPTMERSWLYGPFVAEEDADQLADALWAEVEKLLPNHVTEVEMFFDIANQTADAFGQRHGFTVYKDGVSVLRISRARARRLEPAEAQPLNPAHGDQLAALHDALFPRTFLPPQQLLADAASGRRIVLAEAEGDTLLGYACLFPEPASSSMMLEFLGVAEEGRRRGIGERLVRAAVKTAMESSVEEVALTVDAGNVPARALYAKLGFEHLADTRALRKKLARD